MKRRIGPLALIQGSAQRLAFALYPGVLLAKLRQRRIEIAGTLHGLARGALGILDVLAGLGLDGLDVLLRLLLERLIEPLDGRDQLCRQAGYAFVHHLGLPVLPLFQQRREGAFAAGAEHRPHRIHGGILAGGLELGGRLSDVKV